MSHQVLFWDTAEASERVRLGASLFDLFGRRDAKRLAKTKNALFLLNNISKILQHALIKFCYLHSLAHFILLFGNMSDR